MALRDPLGGIADSLTTCLGIKVLRMVLFGTGIVSILIIHQHFWLLVFVFCFF